MNPMRHNKLDLSRYPDRNGLCFDEVRGYVQKHYGVKVSDWPQVRIVTDEKICRTMHSLLGGNCWNCKGNVWVGRRVQAHHIIGSRGRSDEYCNIAMLDEPCHTKVKTDELPQGRILYLKWTHDRANTDWVRLTLLGRKFLPDLITD